MNTLLRIGGLFLASAFLCTISPVGLNAAPLDQPAVGFADPASAVTQPKTDVALPSTETPLVPKSVIENMKKQPLKEVTPSAQEPAAGIPSAVPLTPATDVARQDEEKAKAATSPEDTSKKAVAENEKVPEAVGRVIWVKGVFMAERKDKKSRKLDRLSIIFEGDTLVTDEKTQAQIAFTDTTLMTFRPDTRFVIAEYSYKPEEKAENGSVGKFVMDLVAGGFRTITGLIPKGNKGDYEVKTPVATIGVRGTDYTVYVGGNKQVVMGQLAGVPTVTTADGKTSELTSENRYATVNPNGTISITTVRPPVLDMSLPVVPATIEPITPKEAIGAYDKIIGTDSGGGSSSSHGAGTDTDSSKSGEWCIL